MIVQIESWLEEKAEKIRKIVDSPSSRYGSWDIVDASIAEFDVSRRTGNRILEKLQRIDSAKLDLEERRIEVSTFKLRKNLKDVCCETCDKPNNALYQSEFNTYYCIDCISKDIGITS